jgi:hypothetical protein
LKGSDLLTSGTTTLWNPQSLQFLLFEFNVSYS